jgi:signal transduction histidine kinase
LNIYLQLIFQWAFLLLIHFLQNPLLPTTDLVHSSIDTVFLLVGYFCLHRVIKHRYRIKNNVNSSEGYVLSFIKGLSISLLILLFIEGIYSSVIDVELNLFNQLLTSSLPSTLWIWVIGSSLLILLSLFNAQFLSGLRRDNISTYGIFFSTFFGLILPLLIAAFLLEELQIDGSIIWISSLLITVLLALTVLQYRFYILNQSVSLLRLLLVMMIFISSSMTAVIYYSFDQVLFTKLVENSKEFEQDNEEKIRQVITGLLNEAYTEVRSISLFSVSNFEQIVEGLIQEEWLRYSFSLQLIDRNGAPLAAYNTNLSVPQWTTDFRIDELIIPYEEERIRKENLRPILRSQPINTVNAEYSYFMRGWIPVYQSRRSENISGWILATLYQEIPELNRPFRSVVNATIQSPEEPAFTFTEYDQGVPSRSIVSGTLTSIPDYGVLPTTIQDYMTGNTEWVQSPTIQNLKLKERFSQSSSGTIIRAAHLQITFPQILYVFLRIYFTVAIPFILIMMIFTSSKIWNTFSESRRIKDRLMDRSIIASIVCLFLLIGATSYILESQNKTQVQEALRDQLITLTETLEEADESDQISTDYLENITAVIGVDASLYTEGRLVNSTTPPMYNQHLIPPTIPWDIYQQIVSEGAQLAIDIFTIGDQELMIGYQPWLNTDKNIAGIVAIPTFLKTPDFYSRLLSTTSYLLAFYSLIFSVLVLIIGVISTRITAPLETLEAGLEKISAGDLETRLKVYSNDEIGTLTKAYNSMASRLKNLQDELAASEREAAWKQMAQQVAHEIKNPLTPMKLNLQHLERQLQQTGEELSLDKPKVAAITKSMIEQIEALNKIASDFSKFAKPSVQKFDNVKVNELISSVVMMYGEDQSNISTEFENREFIIAGVQEELRRVMVNLIKNAQEAISEDGQITIQSIWNKDKKSVDICISDNGKGISKEEAESIFLPNFSTKTSGTGLGLAITKKIIEEHSGSITFDSTVGKGTTFKITFPLKNS